MESILWRINIPYLGFEWPQKFDLVYDNKGIKLKIDVMSERALIVQLYNLILERIRKR